MVFVGFESINPATLKAYNKSQTVENIKECVVNFHQHGIRVHGMFVFGAEDDHYQVIRDTVKFSRDLDLDSLQYLILTPVPGTPFYQEMEAQNRIICKDWSQYDGHFTVFQPKQFTPYELQLETIRAMKKFYSFPSVLRRLIFRDWFYVKLKAYARFFIWRSHWDKSNYVEQLRRQLFSKVRQIRAWFPGGSRIARVGIPADIWSLSTWESKPREFLLRFLERLGVEVVQEGEGEPGAAGPLNAVRSEIARLQEKADVVLLPLWEEARQKLGDLQELSRDAKTKLLPLEFNRCSFYTACMELGLLFQRRLGRIRRVYFQTLQEVGAEI
jgi:hypothetical protein